MTTEIDEPISVGAIFDQGDIKPDWFIWQGRRHAVREITLQWQSMQGRASITHLGVSDGADWFELAFNTRRLTWRLMAIDTEN